MDEFMDTIVVLNKKGTGEFKSFEEQARNSTNGLGTAITVAKTQVVKGVTDIIDALNVELTELGIGSISEIISNVGVNVKLALDTIAQLITGQLSALDFGKSVITMITNFVQRVNEQAPQIITTGIKLVSDLVIGLAQGLPQLIPVIMDTLSTIIDTLIDNIDLIIDAGIELIIGLAEGLINAIPLLIEKAPILIDKLVTKLTDPNMISRIVQVAFRLVTELALALIMAIPSLLKSVNQLKNTIITGLLNMVSSMAQIGINVVKGIWQGISNSLGWIKDKISGWVGNVTKFIKKLFGISSPSKVMRDQVGQWLPKGIAVGIDTNTDSIENSLDDMYDEMNRTISMENAKLNFDVMSNNAYNRSLQLPAVIDLSANFEGTVPVQLNLDGEKIYDNQQKISLRKSVQYGGAK